MIDIDDPSLGEITKPAAWDRTISEGRRVLQRLVGLEQRISHRMAERVQLGMPLEGLTVADLTYQGWWRPLSRTGGARR
jgi:hypothetical protein